MATEAGAIIQSIKARVEVSTGKHFSNLIAIVGHYDCGGNSAEEDLQKDQIREAIALVSTWNNDIEIIELWVDETWAFNKVDSLLLQQAI